MLGLYLFAGVPAHILKIPSLQASLVLASVRSRHATPWASGLGGECGSVVDVACAFRAVVRPSRCLTAVLLVALLAAAVSSAATAVGPRKGRAHSTRTGSSRAAEGVLAGSAKRQDESSSRLLTVVARVCPTYHDVMANLARNDIQESLQDLGKDTVYSSGQPIDPAIEAREQPNCSPLPDWTFTLGTGYQSRAVSGTWGSLSIVTGAFSTSLVTKEKTSLLNDQGAGHGRPDRGCGNDRTDPGAGGHRRAPRLAVDPGRHDDRSGARQDLSRAYGFAALRCAIDNLNGDNVEWIGYPSGASHVFCYAYYVKPPPDERDDRHHQGRLQPGPAPRTLFRSAATSRSTQTARSISPCRTGRQPP